MNIYCDIFEPSNDANESLERLAKEFSGLYGKAWDKDKRGHYEGRKFDPNIPAIARMWLDKSLKIFMAYDRDTNTPVGYLMGIVFRPLPYQANVFQIDDWFHDGNIAVGAALFDYAKQAMRFIGCDEIWITDFASRIPDLTDGSWGLGNEFVMMRYIKR